MKLIFVAKRQLATYLVISALSRFIVRKGCSVRRKGLYSSSNTAASSGHVTPTTTRSGLVKSSIAHPSFKNSGFDATCTSRPVSSLRRRAVSAFVPTGTVLLMTTIASFPKCGAIDSSAVQRIRKSAEPSSRWGVPTARKTQTASGTASAVLLVNFKRPACEFRTTSSTNPGS